MNLLPSALAGPIVAALNHLLEQEPWARKLLLPYAGRIIAFDASAFGLMLRIDTQGLVALADIQAPQPAVTLAVPLQQWPLVVSDVASGGQAAAMRHVRIEGDAELANTVSTLARNLRWDAAEDLARALRAVMGGTVGDSVAQRVVDGAREAHQTALRIGKSVVDNVAEYLLDEQPTLVRHAALADFSADVAALRDDLARLEKRLERLERRAGAGSPAVAPPSAHR